MTPCEMQDAIATLQRDMTETMLELGETRRRVLVLEKARDVERIKRGRGPGRFQASYETRLTERPPSPEWGGSG